MHLKMPGLFRNDALCDNETKALNLFYYLSCSVLTYGEIEPQPIKIF